MNYFALYGLPESFHPDAAAVKNKYYELSRRYHPDRFVQAGAEERAEALHMAALNNEAWKTLRNNDTVMAYILKLHGLLEEEEKYNLPPAFLMEMMDLNEAVSEYEMNATDEHLKQQATGAVREQLSEWAAAAGPLTAAYDAEQGDKALLLRIKDYYFRKKYLLRIQQRIDTFATR